MDTRNINADLERVAAEQFGGGLGVCGVDDVRGKNPGATLWCGGRPGGCGWS
jgi:hypothetical protein